MYHNVCTKCTCTLAPMLLWQHITLIKLLNRQESSCQSDGDITQRSAVKASLQIAYSHV